MSKERAVNFDARQVRATLNGTMTQFRRLLRVQPELPMLWYPTPVSKRSLAYDGEAHFRKGAPTDFAPWKVGDRLWVRETWRENQYAVGRELEGMGSVGYRATFAGEPALKWRPSIHMPRWASRLTLEATEVRVQRLQDISEEDAQAEGIQEHPSARPIVDSGMWTHRAAFRAAWDSLDPGGWDRNPWVWAVSFRRVQG